MNSTGSLFVNSGVEELVSVAIKIRNQLYSPERIREAQEFTRNDFERNSGQKHGNGFEPEDSYVKTHITVLTPANTVPVQAASLALFSQVQFSLEVIMNVPGS